MATTYVNGPRVAYDYETVTVATSAIGCTASKYAATASTNAPYDSMRRAAEILITVETAQLRYRLDGTDPTSSEGHLLEIGDSISIAGYQNITQFRAIRTGAVSGVLKITYYR